MKKVIGAMLALGLVACGAENAADSATDSAGERLVFEDTGECEAGAEFTGQRGEDIEIILCDENGERLVQRGYALYPGATVEATSVIEGGGRDGIMITMSSDASMDAILAFYRQQAGAQNVNLTADNPAQLVGTGPDGELFMVAGASDGEETMAMLSLGRFLPDGS